MVLSLIAEGMTNTEIAASLHLARSTVKRYVSSIMWKLGVHTREEAVNEAGKQTWSSAQGEDLSDAPEAAGHLLAL